MAARPIRHSLTGPDPRPGGGLRRARATAHVLGVSPASSYAGPKPGVCLLPNKTRQPNTMRPASACGPAGVCAPQASQCSDFAACAARLNESRNALCGAAPTGNPATHTLEGESRGSDSLLPNPSNQEKAHEPDHLHRRRHRYRPVHTGILRTPIGPASSPRRICPQLCRAAEQPAGHSGSDHRPPSARQGARSGMAGCTRGRP